MWTLTGLVIISILIGAIASSLTYVTVEKPIALYGRKVGLQLHVAGAEKAHLKKRFLILCLYYTGETFWRSASNLSSAIEVKKAKNAGKQKIGIKKSKILYFCKLRLELFKILWSIA